MADDDVLKALGVLRRHGYDVDEDSTKLITLAKNHLYIRVKSEAGSVMSERAVAIPLLDEGPKDLGPLIRSVIVILETPEDILAMQDGP